MARDGPGVSLTWGVLGEVAAAVGMTVDGDAIATGDGVGPPQPARRASATIIHLLISRGCRYPSLLVRTGIQDAHQVI